jgi:protein associated with RNAse G/E
LRYESLFTARKSNELTRLEELIQVRTYKYDGSLHRSWNATLSRQEDSLLVLDTAFAEEITHDLLGTIASGTHSLEYYWLDRWYNVFRFSDANGELRNYYCNVNVPPAFDGQVLSYVDLDLDILVAPDFSYQLLDVEDFELNAKTFGYSTEIRNQAKSAVDQLTAMIEKRQFPFNS